MIGDPEQVFALTDLSDTQGGICLDLWEFLVFNNQDSLAITKTLQTVNGVQVAFDAQTKEIRVQTSSSASETTVELRMDVSRKSGELIAQLYYTIVVSKTV